MRITFMERFDSRIKWIIEQANGKLLSPPQSITSFLEKEVFKRVDNLYSSLELGSGIDPLSPHLKNKVKVSIDISPSAIQFCSQHDFTTTYMSEDVMTMNLSEQFDLVIDAHTLAFTFSKENFVKSLINIKKHMHKNGILASEFGISHKGFRAYAPFDVRGDLLLKSSQVIRYIPTALELEKAVIESGLKIEYFVMTKQKMIFDDYRDEVLETDLDVIQFILRNSN